MTRLLNKTIVRAVSFFAALLLLGTALAFTGCQSATPKVTMTVSFNGKDYNLEYKLYRKFFPQTVQHFIELADAGYYNGLCFHDYQSGTGMYSGGYTYAEEQSGDAVTRGLVGREYFSWIESNDVTLTQSVFAYEKDGVVPTRGLNTLAGEFESNNYTVENNDKKYGAKKEGALVMYYTDKSEAKSTKVTVKRNTRRAESENIAGDARWYDSRDYSLNSATSLFYVSFSSEASVNKDYCVFAELYNDGAEEEYSALTSAIQAYADSLAGEDGEDNFTEETAELPVDTGDWYYSGYNLTASYRVPVKPIVIKRVKVNRY